MNCLVNGQRIKLKIEMKCLFGMTDLAGASSATVSRIGVVYMFPSDHETNPKHTTDYHQIYFDC